MTTRDPSTEPETSPSWNPGAVDPHYPDFHPRNDPNDVASKVARRDQVRRAALDEPRLKAEADQAAALDRARSEGRLPDQTAYEQAIAAAREEGDWSTVSRLDREYRWKVREALEPDRAAAVLAENQPTERFTDQIQSLFDESRPVEDRIAEAREAGLWWVVSSLDYHRDTEGAATS